jgi:hypothetical protein
METTLWTLTGVAYFSAGIWLDSVATSKGEPWWSRVLTVFFWPFYVF